MADNHTVVRLLLIIAAAFVLFMLIAYYNRHRQHPAGADKQARNEQFATPLLPSSAPAPVDYGASAGAPIAASAPSSASSAAGAPTPMEPLGNEQYRPVQYNAGPKTIKDCYPRDRLTTDDLLPKDAANTKWAQANPAGQGDVRDQNFLSAGYLIGVNTVGQSLRNGNLQLRSEPHNPQYKVSPWNQTTMEPDANRRPLEIGGC